MQIAQEISIRWINKHEEETPPKSEILINGRPTGKHVAGAILEAAIGWNDHYLLFTTDDCPFEEGLNIHMLDSDLNSLDRAILVVPYGTGWLTSLKLLEPDMVQFVFFPEKVWTVQLLPKVRLGMPVFGEERFMIWRPWSFLRRFVIHLDPEKLKSHWTSATPVIDIPPTVEEPDHTARTSMWLASDITTIWLNNLDQGNTPKSEVMKDGAPTGVILDGSKLETALTWWPNYLLVLSDQNASESILNIVLLNYEFEVIDRARLTSGGSLTSLKLVEPSMVQFTFYPDTIWTLEFLAGRRFEIPSVGEKLCNFWRPSSFRRHFIIHRDPAKIKTDVTSVQTIIDIDTKRVNDKHADEQT